MKLKEILKEVNKDPITDCFELVAAGKSNVDVYFGDLVKLGTMYFVDNNEGWFMGFRTDLHQQVMDDVSGILEEIIDLMNQYELED